MLDLDRLRTLHAVAAYGSVSAAAGALNITASAVSQKLGKLEREMKARLIEKDGRGVRLTDAGRLLAEHAQQILGQVENAVSDFEAHRGAAAGRLAVAAFATATRGLLPDVLRTLAERHPRLTVEVRETEPPDAVRDVARGSIDIAVVQDWHILPLAVPRGITRTPLLEDTADLALPKPHRLAGRDSVDLREAAEEPWISSPPGAVCYDLVVQTIRSYDIEPRIVHVAGEYETQLALVAGGFGVSILPRLGRGTLPAGVTVRQTTPALVRSVYAISREAVTARPAIRAVLDALRAVAAAQPVSAAGQGGPSAPRPG